MFSYYTDFIITNKTVFHALYARLFTAVHSVIAKGDRLAVSLPDYGIQKKGFGLVFRVWGDEAALERLSDHLTALLDSELILQLPVKEAPDSDKKIAFIRDRAGYKKNSPSYQRRMMRRAIAAGKEIAEHVLTPSKIETPFVEMRSQSTGNNFVLAVKKISEKEFNKRSSAGSVSGNSFGLGYLVPDF